MSPPTFRALLIGNSTYPADPTNLPDLEGPRNDLALLRDALSDQRCGLFPPDNVRLVAERTMPEVLREIEELLRSTTSRDCVLVYYSGHGRLDQTNDFYLCTRDTNAGFLRSTAVNAGTISKMIDDSAAGTTIIVLDCCHSGAFKGGDDVAERLAGGGRFVITSCRSGELANDADAQNHASMFTHWLVRGLREGAVDADGDGLVGLEALYDYLFERLHDLGRPVPQKRFSGAGDVPIALRPSAEGVPTGPAGLIDQTLSAPILDVAPLELDLGVINPGDPVPPERVAVINRGGGTLDWTAEASDDWMTVTTDASGVLLRLTPRPGLNRANVFIRDQASGIIRTVRVQVRLADRDAPLHAATRAIPTGSASSNGQESAGRLAPATVVAWAAPVLAVVAGLFALVTAAHYTRYIRATRGDFVMLRSDDWGAGIFDSAVLGALLALAGLVALAPLWRRTVLIAGFGLSVALVTLRTGDVIRLSGMPATSGPTIWFSVVTLVLGGLAGGACLIASRGLGRHRGASPWLPTISLVVTTVALVVWATGHLIAPYRDYRGGLGDPGASGLAWLLVGGGIVLVVLATRRLEWPLGVSLLCTVALVPAVDAVGDLVFRVAGRAATETPTIGWWITEVAGLVAIAAVGSMLRPPATSSPG